MSAPTFDASHPVSKDDHEACENHIDSSITLQEVIASTVAGGSMEDLEVEEDDTTIALDFSSTIEGGSARRDGAQGSNSMSQRFATESWPWWDF
jgi:hypothetical protein